jgi:hypothetical protein
MPYTFLNTVSITFRFEVDVRLLVLKYTEDDVEQVKYFIYGETVLMQECSYGEYGTHQERRDHAVDMYTLYIH